jgi:proline iminopeptidase
MTTVPDYSLFPELEPYAHGWLDVPGGHRIYFEQCGNPDGVPAVVLHGGPGSGCNAGQRRFFDPAYYRIILFDQRGCGRSTPAGCIEYNTTWHLVEDIEALRRHLGIQRWMVFGGSWGSTLALAYASTHPQVVAAMVLRGIFLCRPAELDWFVRQSRWFFPEAWERLANGLDASERDHVMVAYQKRIFADDHQGAVDAARNWNAFEAAIMKLLPAADSGTGPDDATTLARARVQLHYLMNLCFLQDRPLLQRVAHCRAIPAVIIQGRYDMVCPPFTAYELHQAWPEAEFKIIPDAGHAASEPGIAAALVAATESFKHLQGEVSRDKTT